MKYALQNLIERWRKAKINLGDDGHRQTYRGGIETMARKIRGALAEWNPHLLLRRASSWKDEARRRNVKIRTRSKIMRCGGMRQPLTILEIKSMPNAPAEQFGHGHGQAVTSIIRRGSLPARSRKDNNQKRSHAVPMIWNGQPATARIKRSCAAMIVNRNSLRALRPPASAAAGPKKVIGTTPPVGVTRSIASLTFFHTRKIQKLFLQYP